MRTPNAAVREASEKATNYDKRAKSSTRLATPAGEMPSSKLSSLSWSRESEFVLQPNESVIRAVIQVKRCVFQNKPLE